MIKNNNLDTTSNQINSDYDGFIDLIKSDQPLIDNNPKFTEKNNNENIIENKNNSLFSNIVQNEIVKEVVLNNKQEETEFENSKELNDKLDKLMTILQNLMKKDEEKIESIKENTFEKIPKEIINTKTTVIPSNPLRFTENQDDFDERLERLRKSIEEN